MSVLDVKLAPVEVAAGVVLRKTNHQSWEVLIAKRQDDKHQGGLWEFPCGKIEVGESPESALQRELKEEVNISISSPQFFKQIDHDYGDKRVRLLFYTVKEFTGLAQGLEGQETCWVPVGELAQYNFPEANQQIVEMVQYSFCSKPPLI